MNPLGTMKKGRKKTGGRQKGTTNHLNRDIKEMIREALHGVGGVGYLVEQARANPTAFMTLVAKIIPHTVAGDPNAPPIQITIERRVVHPDRQL